MKHEIIPGRLYQADADHALFGELEIEGRLPALVVDLAGECRPNLQALDRRVMFTRWRIDDLDYLPDMDRLRTLVAFASHELGRGVTVVSMCGAGCNRSGLFAGMLLLAHFGMDGEEAVARICRANPMALSNPTFRKYLRARGRRASA